MSLTLESCREQLARLLAMLLTGTATAGDTNLLADTVGLAPFEIDDALNTCLVYIAEAGGAAPEGESALVAGYDAATQTITLQTALTAAIAAGDAYHLYFAPLELDDWHQAINDAIAAAWPRVYAPAEEILASTGARSYVLGSAIGAVDQVHVTFTDALEGYPDEPIPRPLWSATGEPGALTLQLRRPVPTGSRSLRLTVRSRYAQLAAGESTGLDPAYLLTQAAANLLATLIAKAGANVDTEAYHKQIGIYQKDADLRRDSLAQLLELGR